MRQSYRKYAPGIRISRIGPPLVGAFVLTFAAWAQSVVPDEVVVQFRPGGELAETLSRVRFGAREIGRIEGTRARLWRVRNASQRNQVIGALRAHPDIEFAEPNAICAAAFVPNDPLLGMQWAPAKIRLPQAWDLGIGAPTAIIAIVDTGVDLYHPDLRAKMLDGWDFVNNDSIPQDDNGHGTHCAGIAGAATNNATGIVGVGYLCKIMPVKVLNNLGGGTTFTVSQGINYAVVKGASVVSLSLVSSATSSVLQSAVDQAVASGVVVVAAAGNDANQNPKYPAAYASVIGVAASESGDGRASFSNYGAWVDVAAPGQGILSTYVGGGYTNLSGTSMATPHVAGLAGLLRARMGPAASVAEIRDRIRTHCEPVGDWVAYGRIDAFRSLNGGEAATQPNLSGPNSFVVDVGSEVSGSAASLAQSDGDHLTLEGTLEGRTSRVIATFNFQGSQAQSLGGITLNFKAHFNPGGAAMVFLYNWTLGGWDWVGVASADPSGRTFALSPPGTGSAYQSSSGLVRARIEAKRSTRQRILLSFDELSLTKWVVP